MPENRKRTSRRISKKTKPSRTHALSLQGKADSPTQPEMAEISGTERNIEIIGLKYRQQSVIPTLVVSPTLVQASRETGVPESTLRRWLNEPAFRREVDRIRKESFDLACKQAQFMMPMALSVLIKCMESEDLTVGLRAARSTISLANELSNTDSIRAELHELTDAVNAGKVASPLN